MYASYEEDELNTQGRLLVQPIPVTSCLMFSNPVQGDIGPPGRLIDLLGVKVTTYLGSACCGQLPPNKHPPRIVSAVPPHVRG